ncbi:adenylate kinase [Anaerococcus sp. NML200574]|uniref:adenylate kinase n=1 Tax=Anaerococcus sp. NML200574 TaxID=2954486 RepID=UPI00223766A4|nr:adenylate kinase [Anaerococcus sp. NML200574]MCW6678826.1 adenylate kinase [Anaerococcus sp. NML200574]
MNIILLGPPGAGKGTLSSKIINEKNAVQIATGDIFRYNISNKTELGMKAKSFMDKGDLVPDELTIDLVWDTFDKLDKEENTIVLFDGFPRNMKQAKALDYGMEERNTEISKVVYFNVDSQILIDRITGRRVCPDCGETYHIKNHKPEKEGICDRCGGKLIQRNDDNYDTVKNRINIYNEQTSPLIDYYKEAGKLITIDGAKTPEEVFNEFNNKLGE